MLSVIPDRRAGQLAAFREAKDQAWAAGRVEAMPAAWAEKLLARWSAGRRGDQISANVELLERSAAITAAHRAGVPADANDGQIVQEAAELARDTARRLDHITKVGEAELADRTPEQRERLIMLGRLLESEYWLGLRGVAKDFIKHARRSIPAALKRMVCEHRWRAVLRGLHARAVESTARAIGLVHKRAGCYVSDDSLQRRRGMLARSARALESVLAVNEHGQDATLAELAAKGPANRQIRRHELMTRIAGFELIAKECSHAAYFVTVTCPSRMHAWRTKPGQSWAVEENPKHDGTLPDQAQAYLCRQWRRFNAAAARAGLEQYGFRIAEPNHDGTPHWHALVFFPAEARGRPAYRVLVRLLRRYFLWNDSPTERGARKHRVKLERIDWQRGSAAGYIAKYVAKNIDGYMVEKDLYGNDTLTSSQRVDAWASTWRIRQFQQLGGAPVGVWRELRRLHPEQAQASAVVAFALDAVNVTAGAEKHESELFKRTTAADGWASYLHQQGGHRVPRAMQRIRVLREASGEIGRYGEAMAPRAVGVVTVEARQEVVPAFGIIKGFTRRIFVRAEVESERADWRIVPMGFDADEGAMRQRRKRLAERLRGIQAGSEAARPWSPVNNCTRPAPLFAQAVERHKKRGRWHRWEKRGPGGQVDKNHEQHPPNHRRTGE